MSIIKTSKFKLSGIQKQVIIVFAIYLVAHMFMHTDYWDDIIFYNLFKEHNCDLIELSVYRWNTWTSRALIHALAYLLLLVPHIIWKILDSMIWAWLYYLISRIVKHDGRNALSILVFISYPLSMMATAGWITTTTDYNIPITIAIWAFLLIKTNDSGTKSAYKVLGCIAFVYACNFELIAYTAAAMLLASLLIPIIRKKVDINLTIVYLIISIISCIYPLFCPGNFVRVDQTASMTILESLRMGINTCFYYFCSVPNGVFLLFNFAIFIASLVVNKDKIIKVVGILPLLIDLCWTFYFFVSYTIKNRSLTYVYPDVGFVHHSIAEQMLVLISSLVWVVSVCFLLYRLFDEESIKYIFIFISGLIPEVVLGFTNGVTPSMIRVSIFVYIAMIIIGTRLFDILVNDTKNKRIVYYSMYFMSLIAVTLNLFQLVRHIMVYG